MPPKSTGSSGKAQGPSKQELEAINKYLAQRPDFDKLLNEAPVEAAPGTSKREATEVVVEATVVMPVIPGDNDKDMKEQLSKGAEDAKAAKAERQGNVASSDHHKANLGPAIAEKLPEPASKEELKKRSEELNK